MQRMVEPIEIVVKYLFIKVIVEIAPQGPDAIIVWIN